MHNVLEEMPNGLCGVSITPGTGNIEITGNAPLSYDLSDHLADGQRVWYHRYYSDFSTVAAESGYGDWHAGDGEIQNKVVEHDPFTSVAAGLAIANWQGLTVGDQ